MSVYSETTLLDLVADGDVRRGFIHGVLVTLDLLDIDGHAAVLDKLGIGVDEVNRANADIEALPRRTEQLYEY